MAKLTKVSKVTIYRKLKLKLNEVKPFIITKQGKSHVDEHGYHVITELKSEIEFLTRFIREPCFKK